MGVYKTLFASTLIFISLTAGATEDESIESEAAMADSDAALVEARYAKARRVEEVQQRNERIRKAKIAATEARELEAKRLEVAHENETRAQKLRVESNELQRQIKASERLKEITQNQIDKSNAEIVSTQQGVELIKNQKAALEKSVEDLKLEQIEVRKNLENGLKIAAQQEKDNAAVIVQLGREKIKLAQVKEAFKKAIRDVEARRNRQTQNIDSLKRSVAAERAEIGKLREEHNRIKTEIQLRGG